MELRSEILFIANIEAIVIEKNYLAKWLICWAGILEVMCLKLCGVGIGVFLHP